MSQGASRPGRFGDGDGGDADQMTLSSVVDPAGGEAGAFGWAASRAVTWVPKPVSFASIWVEQGRELSIRRCTAASGPVVVSPPPRDMASIRPSAGPTATAGSRLSMTRLCAAVHCSDGMTAIGSLEGGHVAGPVMPSAPVRPRSGTGGSSDGAGPVHPSTSTPSRVVRPARRARSPRGAAPAGRCQQPPRAGRVDPAWARDTDHACGRGAGSFRRTAPSQPLGGARSADQKSHTRPIPMRCPTRPKPPHDRPGTA